MYKSLLRMTKKLTIDAFCCLVRAKLRLLLYIYVCLRLKNLIYSAYLRGCSSLCCTNQAGGAIYSVGALPGGAAVSAAPTKQTVPSTLLVHLRQVHPL